MFDRALVLLTFAFASSATSCTDPVNEAAIERLGPEQDGVPEGPDHRPGQPCVVCHSEGGPASRHTFAIAGTVYGSSSGARGAAGVNVFFVDSESPYTRRVTTNGVGNFFVRQEEWPELAFPFKTGIRRGTTDPVEMKSTVNRDGSCNFCHRPGGDSRTSIGPIVAPGGGGAAP